MTQKYASNKLYKVVRKQVREAPWKIGTLINLILIPTAIKTIIIALTDIKFIQFATPSIPFYILFTALYVNIGISLGSIKDIFTGGKWKDMTSWERFRFVLTWVLIAATFALVCWLGKKVKDGYDELIKYEELEEENRGLGGGDGGERRRVDVDGNFRTGGGEERADAGVGGDLN